MPNAIRLWVGTAACGLVSLLAAFFVVFNVVFSDVFGASERFGTFVYAAVAYFIVAFAAGLIGPAHVRRWVWTYSVPAVAVLVLYTFSEPQNAMLHLGFALLVPLASLAGARAGARLRAKKAAPPPPRPAP